MTESTELAELTIVTEENALQVLTRENAMVPYLAHVRSKIDEFESNVSCDVSTEEGRKEIKKFARGIVKIKTNWINLGKHAAAELKKEPVKLDKTRKRTKETLEEWIEGILEPVTKWEEDEKSRAHGIESRINAISDLSNIGFGDESRDIQEKLDSVMSVPIDDSFHEFQNYAQITKDASEKSLSDALAIAKKHEAEKADLENLRKEKAERDQKDRDDKLKRDAAAKATADAEAEANKRAALAKEKVEKEKQEAKEEVERKQKEIDDANELANQAIKDANQAKADAEQAIKDAKKREEEAEARAAQKVIDDKKAEDEAERKRAANTKHKGSINRLIVNSLVEIEGVSVELAKKIVTKLVKRQVPNTKITY